MNKVLLVRLSSMGDLIHTFPAITDLALAHPDLSLSWLCEEAFIDIAALHPFIKKVIPMAGRRWRKNRWDKENRKERAQLKINLRQENFDAVIDSQGLIKSALYAREARAPIFGLDKKSARESLASLLYQHKYTVPWGQLAIERNRQLFAQAFNYTLPEKCHFGLEIPDDNQLSDELTQPYAVLLHATSQDRKLWAESNWLELAQALWQKDQLISYLPWGNPEEKQRAERIAANKPAFIHVCPKLTLKQATHLLHHAKCIAGVDTGLLHLANALEKPLCGIYTDTDPNATGVLPTKNSVNLGNKGKIPSVEDVYATLHNFLLNSMT